MRNITELNYRTRRPGWCVRFNTCGIKVSKDFYNHKYGGKEKALRIAKRFRDAIEREIEPNRDAASSALGRMTKRNKTGVVGVERVDRPYMKDGHKCRDYKYVAHWPTINGKREHAQFAVRKHGGERRAMQLAVNARLKGIHELNEQLFQTFRPPAQGTKLWRYMDFTKFVSMLENNGLFFSRSTSMADAFEGGYSRGNEELRDLVYNALGQFTLNKRANEKRRNEIVLSCWHGNDYEFAAMWKLYSSANESICIQTTFGRLRRCLPLGVEIGRVQYVDYETEWVPERHRTLPFLYKRKSFEHEQEFRAIRDLADTTAAGHFTNEPNDGGLWVDCDLSDLIESIYVAPHVRSWFRELVEQVVRRYDFNIPVLPSSLELKPNV